MKDRGMMLATALAVAFVVAACIGSAVTSSHMSQTAAMHELIERRERREAAEPCSGPARAEGPAGEHRICGAGALRLSICLNHSTGSA